MALLSERIEALRVKAEQLYGEIKAINDELTETPLCGPVECHMDDATCKAKWIWAELERALMAAKAGGR